MENMPEELTRLDAAATAAPWYIRYLDDDRCMSAIALSTQPDTGEHEDMDSEWEGLNIVAACRVQHPPYVVPEDRKWHDNAELLVGLRNAHPELLRLARIGSAIEAKTSRQIEE